MKTVHVIMAVLLLLVLPFSALAQDQNENNSQFDYSDFATIPVMHEGRLKPLNSFARTTLKQLSGQNELDTISVNEWLAIVLFDPQNAAQIPTFKIENALIKTQFGLEEKQDLYTFAELQHGLKTTAKSVVALLDKDAESLTKTDSALLSIHENTALFINLSRSFSALLPLNINLPEKYASEIEGALTFTELARLETSLKDDLKTILQTKSTNANAYNAEELKTAQAAYEFDILRNAGIGNTVLKIIPINWNAERNWSSPWTVLMTGQSSPASGFLLSQWQELASAFRNGNAALWSTVSADILDETLHQNQTATLSRLYAEQIYTGTHPYMWIMALYLLAIAGTALVRAKPHFKWAPEGIATCGIILHITAISARSFILERPPVGTLYESVIFVALICAALGLYLGTKKRNTIALASGLVSALILLSAAPIFAPKADSMEVLVAVLNTNFWLTTHVLIITAGYGICLITGCLAHAALYLKAFKNDGAHWLTLQKNIHHLSLAALLFTAVGTVLGGIWADQSWGRFWGWDPKENGALLIVLWLIWVQHGRISQKIPPVAFTALMAALNIIVALSWFGVNLLGVGLHSYGFTSGMAGGLIAFCAIEALIITALYIKNTHRKSAA